MFGGANTYFAGLIANFAVCDMIATQRDIDILMSVPITVPTALQGQDYQIQAIAQPYGDTLHEVDFQYPVITRDATRVFRQGNTNQFDSTDTIKLIGRL